MTQTITLPSIINIEFLNNSILFVHLANDRTFIVPIDKFPAIKALNKTEQKEFEIIDDTNLSFLSIDEIFSLEELIWINNLQE